LPYYHGHYFHDTQVTMSRWRIAVLTGFRYSRVKKQIDFKVQNQV